eukprot:CAMPEP_0178704506 /NCGR_PEP_ID=MMETSP0699-20121125/14224_1 /TAXON_ID=265572 /ORGANISM="Extubocellulus spinifer, Strain CCMP396" /LENGTH=120 /DNA_ID=CAMNT_0020351873 /DNA_START=849 /DNA_END=1211 /DNA_ORIENTATION=-
MAKMEGWANCIAGSLRYLMIDAVRNNSVAIKMERIDSSDAVSAKDTSRYVYPPLMESSILSACCSRDRDNDTCLPVLSDDTRCARSIDGATRDGSFFILFSRASVTNDGASELLPILVLL